MAFNRSQSYTAAALRSISAYLLIINSEMHDGLMVFEIIKVGQIHVKFELWKCFVLDLIMYLLFDKPR